jgi:glycerol-3-phosphate acyltransferase PlsX
MDDLVSSQGRIRIVVDAMGGDFAPVNEIEGSLLALRDKGNEIEIILVGKRVEIEQELKKIPGHADVTGIEIVNASEVVTMHDSPTDSLRTKPGSSISVGLNLQKEGKADAFISAGNTGAVMAASVLRLGRIKGVGRPSIGSEFPTEKGRTMVFDVGASVDCKPNHLLEFAIMGSIYMKCIFKVGNPRVALLNVGEEKSKGDELTIEAYSLMERASKEGRLNFAGNAEGRDILSGEYDLIICDGFAGNVVLKFAESVPGFLKTKFKDYAGKGLMNKIKVGMMRGTLRNIMKEFDYQEYGGVPLLGVDGVSIIGHGKSTPLAIKNMIRRAVEVIRNKVNEKIKAELSKTDKN